MRRSASILALGAAIALALVLVWPSSKADTFAVHGTGRGSRNGQPDDRDRFATPLRQTIARDDAASFSSSGLQEPTAEKVRSSPLRSSRSETRQRSDLDRQSGGPNPETTGSSNDDREQALGDAFALWLWLSALSFDDADARFDLGAGSPRRYAPNRTINLPERESVPVVHAAPGLPDWFARLDTDGDGQIGLYEWTAAGGSVSEFQKLDRDQDGFLGPAEVRIAVLVAPGKAGAGASLNTDADNATGLAGRLVDGASERNALAASPPTSRQILVSPGAVSKPRVDRSNAARPTSPSPSVNTASTAAKTSPTPPPSSPTPPTVKPVAVATVKAAAPQPKPVLPLAATPQPLIGVGAPYWEMRNTQNQARSAQGHANVLFLGDSITDLLRTGEGNPVWQQYFAPLGAADFAVGSASTSQVLWQIQTGQVAAVTPNVIVLMIGTNNLAIGQTPAETAMGITTITTQLQEQLPNSRIVLLGVLPRGQRWDSPFRAPTVELNRRIASLGDGKRIYFLDFGSVYLQRNGSLAPNVMLMPDLVHPSQHGYELYASAIWRTLQAALRN